MNENTNSPQSNQPKPRRLHSKPMFVGVLFLAVVVVALLIYRWPSAKNSVLPTADTQQNVTTSDDGGLHVYYYTVDDSSQQNTRYNIFKVSPDLGKPDTATHSFSIMGRYPSVVTDSWKKDTMLFVSNAETQAIISSVDVSAQDSQPQTVLAVPLDTTENERVADARFVDGGTAIAFIIADGRNERAENSVLHIVSLQDQSKTERYPLSEKSPLYAGFGFLVATPDSHAIYLHETGGDGGFIWSQWYNVDRTTKTVKKMEGLPPIPQGEENPTASTFSPDRTKLAYADFSAVVDPDDVGQEYEEGQYGRCLRFDTNLLQKYASFGGTVLVRDLRTGATNEIFRNLSYQDNFCKNVGNRIISLRWLDDSLLAFETIDGVYAIDVNSKQRKTLFTFEETVSPGQQTRPALLSIQQPFIIFSDRSIVQTGTNKRLELVTPDAQQGYFFVSE
ncbi:hypothetical protein HY416_00865 [Candidatus Kaiserbacteria bacterium]|nr:hypothetical protein [Candidatus Kaiserbacteria bacterium]